MQLDSEASYRNQLSAREDLSKQRSHRRKEQLNANIQLSQAEERRESARNEYEGTRQAELACLS